MRVVTSITASLLATRNRNRKSLIIQNVDGTDSVYVKRERGPVLTVSATDFDFRIGPSAAIALNSLLDGQEAIQDSYSIIASANTPAVSIFETEDIIR